MARRARVSVADLEATVEGSVAALGRGLTRDWSVPAGTLRWSCAKTAFHIGDDLVAYAGQLASGAQDDYLPFRCRMVRGTPPGGLLDWVSGMGVVLATTVRAARPQDRAYHSYGMADAEGFTALGAAEVLVHSHDVAEGLGLRYQPDPAVCARVTARLFRDLEPHDDPWRLLLWATGRADLPGRGRSRQWTWWAAPEGERDG